MKSLGQIAYETYRDSPYNALYELDDHKPWENMTPAERDLWEDVAKNVLMWNDPGRGIL
jgi:hypothetical protein